MSLVQLENAFGLAAQIHLMLLDRGEGEIAKSIAKT